jgi:hypothetical protein
MSDTLALLPAPRHLEITEDTFALTDQQLVLDGAALSTAICKSLSINSGKCGSHATGRVG